MRIFITLQNGATTEALLLAMGRDQMRVIMPGQPDAIAVSKQDGSWYTESGDSLQLEGALAVEGVDYAATAAQLAPRTMTAGN